MSLRRLFYVSRQQRLPRLRHHLTSGRELDTWDEEVNILLEAGLMRDWASARELVQSKGKPVQDLFWELSRKRKPNWRRRLRNLLIVMLGGYLHDPHRPELYELVKGKPYVRTTNQSRRHSFPSKRRHRS